MSLSKYRFIAADITSNCNVRCPFCLNDWRNIRGSINMREETFSKLIQLIPLAMDEGFFFSCLFEPTIHPDFVPYLLKLPASGRQKVFFTTNLAKRLPRETFYELRRINVHHINISLDSLNPVIYEDLRRGAKFDTFMGNLENLVSVFRGYPGAPRIGYITMLFKQNLNEILDLVSVCHERYLAYHHDVRTPFEYSLAYMDKEWIQKSMVSRKEWDELGTELRKLPFNSSLCIPPPPIESEASQRLESYKDPRFRDLDRYLHIKVSSDGTLYTYWDSRFYNINEIEDPHTFFKKRLCQIVKEYEQYRLVISRE